MCFFSVSFFSRCAEKKIFFQQLFPCQRLPLVVYFAIQCFFLVDSTSVMLLKPAELRLGGIVDCIHTIHTTDCPWLATVLRETRIHIKPQMSN